MKTTLNCHKVLAGTSGRKGYLDELKVKEAHETALRSARTTIREGLRQGLANWARHVERRVLFDQAFTSLSTATPHLRPKFRLQGSFVYHTANDPAHSPPQKIDMDDGLYMPTSFFEKNGAVTPAIASRGFFVVVEQILEPLRSSAGAGLAA